jgi:hypothetical protein
MDNYSRLDGLAECRELSIEEANELLVYGKRVRAHLGVRRD